MQRLRSDCRVAGQLVFLAAALVEFGWPEGQFARQAEAPFRLWLVWNPPASWRWKRQLNIKQCLMQADMWHMDTYGWDCSHVFCVWGISWNFQHFSHVFFFCDPFFWVTKVVRPLPWSRNFWFPDSPSLAAKSESVRPRFVGSLRGPSFASAGLSAKSTTGSMVKCSTQRMIVAGYLFTVRNAN